MTSPKGIAPSPEVQYLPTVFRRIQQGNIRMPAFQRGFVWKDPQILELLRSIYQGFPIGSVLLWNAEHKEMQVEDPAKSFLPVVEERFPTNYILDGLQRLSSLYAVFHFKSGKHPPKFDVSFDLEAKTFAATADRGDSALPLGLLFKPNEFIDFHKKLQTRENGRALIDTAVELLTVFQEYQIPIVSIVGRSPSDVVQIFERINSTGTRLGAVDFMRAVTWSERFDLNQELAKVKQFGLKEGFDVPDETLVKLFAVALCQAPTSDAMLKMRGFPINKLRRGVRCAGDLLGRVCRFLKKHLFVHSFAMVPYEAQFLAVAGFCSAEGTWKKSQAEDVARWYWTASLNEDMQGRSEHQVARIVESMRHFRAGDVSKLKGRLTLGPTTLKERRFRSGTALSSALGCMLARQGCRSLVTGEDIPLQDYMAEGSGRNFVALLDEQQVGEALNKSVVGGKSIANTVVAADADLPVFRAKSAPQIVRALRRALPDQWQDVLGSQLITPAATQALTKGRPLDFLEHRATRILEVAGELAFPP